MKNNLIVLLTTLICFTIILLSCKKESEENETPQAPPKPTFTDPRDGQVYVIVDIGSQTWMAENLRATQLPDGTPIPVVESDTAWDWLAWGENAYCWYSNDSASNAILYGALYSWAAAMNGDTGSLANPSGVQGICPAGWHLPSDSEWKQLEMHLGMSQPDANDIGFRGDVGSKLKEAGTIHWNSPDTGATNESGFTALPSGGRFNYGSFAGLGMNAFYWSTSRDNYSAWIRSLNSNQEGVYRLAGSEINGISVRCIKN